MMKERWGKAVLLLVVAAAVFVFACEQKEAPETKLSVSDQSFFIRKDSPNAYVVDGRGQIKNNGPSDVRRVEVTANCLSCGEEIIVGKWFVSDVEKTAEQCDTISYIAAGGKEEFAIKGVAFMYNKVPEPPDHIPENIKVVIRSFETVPK